MAMIQVTERQLKEAFDLFDKDQDGFISPDELATILRSLGQNPTGDEVRSLLRSAMNAHGEGSFTARDGMIDYNFFCKMMSARVLTSEDSEAELKDAFRVLDKQGQGFITTTEMALICRKLGQDLDHDEVESMITEAISNYEGKVYYDGFVKTLISRDLLGKQDL